MEFKINPASMATMFPLPSAVVDENIRLASAVQLKALIYFFRKQLSGETVTCQDIADATGYDKEDITDAMIFWQERGIVMRDVAAKEIVAEVKKASEEKPEKIKNKKETKEAKETKEITVQEIPVSKPSHEQIAVRCQECAEFRALFQEAQTKLGRTLGYEGQATLIMLHDSYGLPMEVILMLIEYAKTKGKTGNANLANLGKIWAENEIDTLESAESYIEEQTGTDGLWREFKQLSGVKNTNPTTKQRRFFNVWSKEYGFGVDMIYTAYEICIDNTEKMNLEYMDKILKSWYEKGVKTPVDVEKDREQFALSKKKTAKTKEVKTEKKADCSYDLGAFEKKAVGLKYKKD